MQNGSPSRLQTEEQLLPSLSWDPPGQEEEEPVAVLRVNSVIAKLRVEDWADRINTILKESNFMERLFK